MVSQTTLAERFEAGDEHGRASNVAIRQFCGGWTALVGYGWAVYAVRDNSGTIHGYRGWYGYSPSTSSQLTKMRLSHPGDRPMKYDGYEARVDTWHQGAPRVRDFEGIERLEEATAAVEA